MVAPGSAAKDSELFSRSILRGMRPCCTRSPEVRTGRILLQAWFRTRRAISMAQLHPVVRLGSRARVWCSGSRQLEFSLCCTPSHSDLMAHSPATVPWPRTPPATCTEGPCPAAICPVSRAVGLSSRLTQLETRQSFIDSAVDWTELTQRRGSSATLLVTYTARRN